MITIHFGWDGIEDGKKKDGTDVKEPGIKYYKTGIADSEKLGYSKELPVLEFLEESKGSVQIGVRIYFETPQEYETFKADIFRELE